MGRMKDRLAAWALRHAYTNARGTGEGSLVYIDAEGVVRECGPCTPAELEGLGWAWGVAYRSTSMRWERTRLAGLRGIASRVAKAGALEQARLKKAGAKGVQEG